jgi:hypothetical protein
MIRSDEDLDQLADELCDAARLVEMGLDLDRAATTAQDARDTGHALTGRFLAVDDFAQARIAYQMLRAGEELAVLVSARRRGRMSTRLAAKIRTNSRDGRGIRTAIAPRRRSTALGGRFV